MQVKMQTHTFVKQLSHVPVSCFIYALVNVPYCLYFWHQNVKNQIIQTVVYELHQAVVTPRQLAWLILIAIWTSTSLPSGCSLLLWWRCQQRYPSKHQEGQPLSINLIYINIILNLFVSLEIQYAEVSVYRLLHCFAFCYIRKEKFTYC